MKHLQVPETKPNNKNTKKNHLIMQRLIGSDWDGDMIYLTISADS